MTIAAVPCTPRVEVGSGRYPFVPVCACGWRTRGYVAHHAAQGVAEAHAGLTSIENAVQQLRLRGGVRVQRDGVAYEVRALMIPGYTEESLAVSLDDAVLLATMDSVI